MNEIITEYGGGLFALAVEEGMCDRILEETRMLTPLMTADYTRLLINPNLPKEKRIEIAGELLDGRVHPYVANFMKLMTERRLAAELAGCFREFERLYYEHFRVVEVIAESAVALSDSQKKRLEEKLTAHTGCRIEVHYNINPALIAGMRLFYSNREIDDSIKTRLAEIGAVLSDTVV